MKRKPVKTSQVIFLLILLVLLAITLFFRWQRAEDLRAGTLVPGAEETAQAPEAPAPETETAAPEETPEELPEPTPEAAGEPAPEPESEPAPEPQHYTIDENALSGPRPDPARYGESANPSELMALLESDRAKNLIGDQELVWNPDIVLFPDSTIHWYLDDTILVIVWQEVEAQSVGTFSEVFIADGSQLRRKICEDTLFSFDFHTTTTFAQQTNGVLTFGGDFYHHARECGIGVYQREIYRFRPDNADTCFITSGGDMLFSRYDEMSSQEEAQRFIEENDVLFSLCFGPILIENGEDVTPYDYWWGEVRDRYARAVLGMMGERHYLCMNLNCGTIGTEYYNLVTLQQATDAMMRRNVKKAYALDGGQTATTVLGGELINPVQFGEQTIISDVIYFATAIPN